MSDFGLAPEIVAARAIQAAQANMLAQVGDQTVVTTSTVNTVVVLQNYFKPDGALYESIPRWAALGTNWQPNDQQLLFVGIGLPAGLDVHSISFVTTFPGATVSPTELFFGLWDMDLNMLATTPDDGTNPWAGETAKTLPIAQTADGASDVFTTTYEGLHYVSLTCSAGTRPLLQATGTPLFSVAAPFMVCEGNFGITGPPSFPFQGAVAGSANIHIYTYVS